MMIRTSDIAQAAIQARSIQTLKNDLSTTAAELSTGKVRDVAEALGARAGSYSLTEKAITDIAAEEDRIGLTRGRLGQIGASLDGVLSLATAYAGEVTGQLATNADALTIYREDARSRLGQTLNLLNTQFGDRTLFAGDETGSAAIAGPDAFFARLEDAVAGADTSAELDRAIDAFFAPGGGFDTDVYRGGDDMAAGMTFSDGTRIEYDVRANDPAFRGFLEGLARLTLAPEDADAEWTGKAVDKLHLAEGDILRLVADNGRKTQTLERTVDLQEIQKDVLRQISDETVGIDPYEAALKLRALENQLTTAFEITSRIASLSLTNFVR